MRSVSTTVTLPEATNYTLALIRAARLRVAKTWREPGGWPWRYSKADVITTDLIVLEATHRRCLIGHLDRERSGPLMAAIDACNARFGRSGVVPAQRRPRGKADLEHEVQDADAALHLSGQ